MSKGFVLLGDKTTHGGTVISASSTMFVQGKTVALWAIWLVVLSLFMALTLSLKARQNGFLMGSR